jgi:hypothetical protein
MKIGSYKIETTTLVAFALMLAAAIVVWVTSSEPHREEILAAMIPVVATVLASMPAMVRRGAAPIFLVMLAGSAYGCGGGVSAGIATAVSVAKPVAIGICEAARWTTNVCDRNGAYAESSGGESESDPAAP